MTTIPQNLPDQVAWLADRIAELERRFQNQRRTGKVTEVDYDKKLARVELTKNRDGEAFLSPWMPWKTIAAGATKVNVPPSVGQQVDVVSESGDIADGVIESSIKSNDNELPAANAGEGHITTGSTVIFFSGSKIRFRADEIVINAKALKMVKG